MMPPKKILKNTITFTCAEVGENHVGMEAINRQGLSGVRAAKGFSVDHLAKVATYYAERGYDARIFHLDPPEGYESDEPAAILIVREFLNEDHSRRLLEDASELEWDTKYLDTRRGKVLNKLKRKNLLFADFAQEPEYEKGKGRVVPIKELPTLAKTLRRIEKVFPLESLGIDKGLIAEGNFYPINKNGKEDPNIGIGFHGDTERRIVIGFRVGEPMNLVYEWYQDAQRIGQRYEFVLGSGDMYAMSNKATGYDWKKRSKVTLRHAAGSKKITT